LLGCLLGAEAAIDEPFLTPSGSLKSTLNLTVDLVVETWDGREEMRLQDATILGNPRRVARVEADSQLLHDAETEEHLLEGMRIGQVGDEGLPRDHGDAGDCAPGI